MTTINEHSAEYALSNLQPVIASAHSARGNLTDSLPIWLSAQTRKSAGRGRSADNTLQYGVQKLRELILELVVRGKLVPQDPNDEPASVLLEKIAEEKTRLVKEGFAKKAKKLPTISEDEKPYTIPKNWHWARLPEVYISISPSGKKLKTSELKETGKYPVVDQGQSHVAGYFDDESLLIEIPNPVVVFGDHTKARKYIDFNFIPGADGTKILCPVMIFPRFFFLHLLQYNLEDRGYGRHFKILNSNLFAVPPLAEQHRIVKKVDELMALCDQLEQQQADAVQAHDTLVKVLLDTLTQSETAEAFQQNWRRIAEHFDTLFTTESSIDQLKQTLLQLAVMGKLVPQDPNDEPASVLLEKIAEEKAQLVKEGKIKKQKKLASITKADCLYPPPNRWEWIRFGEVVNFRSEQVKASDFPDMEQVAPDSIEKGTGKLISRRTVSESGAKGPNNRFYAGQILYSKIRPSLSKAIIAEFDGLCSADMYPLDVHISPEYLLKAILSEPFLAQVRVAENRIKMPKLNIESLSNITVALPPIAEQHRIVNKVDELMALCDQLKDRLNQAQILQQQLADAVVETMI